MSRLQKVGLLWMYMNIFLFNGYFLQGRANSTHPILWLESKTSLRSFVIFQIFFPGPQLSLSYWTIHWNGSIRVSNGALSKVPYFSHLFVYEFVYLVSRPCFADMLYHTIPYRTHHTEGLGPCSWLNSAEFRANLICPWPPDSPIRRSP